MPTEIEELLKAAREKPMTLADLETQRRSFAYGNAHIENSRVTREMVDAAAHAIKP